MPTFEFLACRIISFLRGYEGPLTEQDNRRIVAIGDVHGCLDGIKELLFQAGITRSVDSCDWRPQVMLVFLTLELKAYESLVFPTLRRRYP